MAQIMNRIWAPFNGGAYPVVAIGTKLEFLVENRHNS